MSWISRVWNSIRSSKIEKARQHLESLEKSDWRPGLFVSKQDPRGEFTSRDRIVLGWIQSIWDHNRDSQQLDDALDVAEGLMIKGFLYRLRCHPLHTNGFSGPTFAEAIPTLQDSLQYCSMILRQYPCFEAVEVSSRANLYLGETYIAFLVTQSVQEFKDKAIEYLSYSLQQSQETESHLRVEVCQGLLRQLSKTVPKW